MEIGNSSGDVVRRGFRRIGLFHRDNHQNKDLIRHTNKKDLVVMMTAVDRWKSAQQ